MKLAEMAKKIEESCICCLYLDNSIIGFRVMAFDITKEDFNYYDFEKEFVTDEVVKNYINSHYKEFKKIALHSHNGSYMSQAEINGTIQVLEFRDSANANAVLQKVVAIKEV